MTSKDTIEFVRHMAEEGEDFSSDEVLGLLAEIDSLRRENQSLAAQLRILRPAAQRAVDELERALDGP